MIKLLRMDFRTKKSLFSLLAICGLSAAALVAGCGDEPTVQTATEKTQSSTVSAYRRQQISFFKGIDEPSSDEWEEMANKDERLKHDGFNIVTLSPPVLITERAGGQPRVILEGVAGSVTGTIDELHLGGLAVFVSPTTEVAGFDPRLDASEATLRQLTEDTLQWAATAEEKQAELFSPLTEYNLVLGTDAANKWSMEILPQIREKYRGELVARVVPDINTTVGSAGAVHDFELLDFRGYDYLMLDIEPHGESFDPARFDMAVDELIKRANAVARRDGLKGVLVEFGAWREAVGVEPFDGPELGEGGQAILAERMIHVSLRQTKGIFWLGWTLPGRGALDHMVEASLRLGWQ
ncbi:MAG: hypothetical protein Q7K29_05415 [Thermoleophilia bacterium]|nr:hypothetical protein [Thermoleophilia bacterium]